jgi:vacuolar-type H+-ATPase subunit F/Vma7
MRTRHPAIVCAMVVLTFALAGCKETPVEEETGGSDLATVEPIAGSDVSRVTLTEEAAERIDVQTMPVRSGPGHAALTIPYAAVLYDPAGETWTYTSPDALVFVRAPINVIRINGERALLSDGPAVGTAVVTVGAAELLGTEYEVGEE